MSNFSICDLCGIIFKPNSKKYAIVMKELVETENQELQEYSNPAEYMQALRRKYDDFEVKEICEECKKVYDYLFNMRINEVEKIKQHIKQSFKLKSKEK